MAILTDLYISAEKLKILYDTVKAKNEKGLSITVSINDETSQYGSNVSSYVSQTKEEREAKKDKFYIGNGKVFWTDGKVTLAERKEKLNQDLPQAHTPKQEYANSPQVEDDILPF
jgi:hypothetical protein